MVMCKNIGILNKIKKSSVCRICYSHTFYVHLRSLGAYYAHAFEQACNFLRPDISCVRNKSYLITLRCQWKINFRSITVQSKVFHPIPSRFYFQTEKSYLLSYLHIICIISKIMTTLFFQFKNWIISMQWI